ncbi:MAG: hypothetical protein NTW65_06715 [Deltaproteobacteria bacterium]|nr:hypothetical protein [Deltaproteobacteria bacterium]
MSAGKRIYFAFIAFSFLCIVLCTFQTGMALAGVTKVVPPIRNKNIKVLCSCTMKTKNSTLDSFWSGYYEGFLQNDWKKQLNSEGQNDGNSFTVYIPSDQGADGAMAVDFEFRFLFNDIESTASLQMSGWGCGLIHKFTAKYRAEIFDKTLAKEADKIHEDASIDLIRQAYSRIHNGWGIPPKKKLK